jgi:cysteine-rich repeat protein
MSFGIARAYPGALVALIIWSGCAPSRPLHLTGIDAGDRDTGDRDAIRDDVTGGATDGRRDLPPVPPLPCACANPCGNGTLDPGEQCDDGNKQPGDGCTALCQVQEGWTCPVPGLPCIPDPNPDANPNP